VRAEELGSHTYGATPPLLRVFITSARGFESFAQSAREGPGALKKSDSMTYALVAKPCAGVSCLAESYTAATGRRCPCRRWNNGCPETGAAAYGPEMG
jgi:hypothetical protein